MGENIFLVGKDNVDEMVNLCFGARCERHSYSCQEGEVYVSVRVRGRRDKINGMWHS